MIRCAYITHQLAKTSEGGAEGQIYMTQEHVCRLRPEYEICRFNPWTDSIDDFDMIHIFAPTNFSMESAAIATYAKEHGKKVLTTPIFYPIPGGGGWRGDYSQVANKLLSSIHSAFQMRPLDRLNPYIWLYRTLQHSDLILPNSRMEQDALGRHFGIGPERFRIIPNGVDMRFAKRDPALFIESYGMQDFILAVGRIEPPKNTLGLIEGFKRSGLDADLVIIGKPVDTDYYERCRSASTERVHFIPPIPHRSDLLPSAYAAAKVVALVSRYETVGLVALEGGLAGANVVVTKNGGAREYLGDDAWYVDPRNVHEVAEALRDAHRSERRLSLGERIGRKVQLGRGGKADRAGI